MRNITIVEGESFDSEYRDYGLLEFVGKVLHGCKDKKEHGLTGVIKVEEVDILDSLTLYNESGEEFIITYEIDFCTSTKWGATFCLMKRADVPSTVIDLHDGYATSKFSNVDKTT